MRYSKLEFYAHRKHEIASNPENVENFPKPANEIIYMPLINTFIFLNIQSALTDLTLW